MKWLLFSFLYHTITYTTVLVGCIDNNDPLIGSATSTCIGMAIGLMSNGYPQKIPTMGRVKPRFYGSGHGSG